MADRDTPPRMKSCTVPMTAADFDPSKTYEVDDLVAIGEYAFVAVDSTKVLWLCSPYGVAANISQAIISSSGLDLLRVLHTGGAADIELATTTRSKNTAELIAVTNAMPSFNVSVTGNPAWLAVPPVLSSGSGTSNFIAGHKVFQCKRRVVGSGHSSIFPVETSLYAPQDVGYWEELVGYTPEVGGERRTWCNAQNPIERNYCGRCGKPL